MRAVEQELRRFGRRFMGLWRTVVLVGVTGIAFVRAGDEWPLVLGIGVAAVVWSAVFVFRAGRWVVAVDVVLVAALCLAQRWVVPGPDLDNSANWVLAVVSGSTVAYQWYASLPVAYGATAVLVVAYVTGVSLADSQQWLDSVPIGLWTFAETTMSRVIYVLLRSGARLADRSTAVHEQAQRDATIAAARRAEERDYLAALHDTAASTMLAAGLGMVDGSEPWMAAQAERDMALLTEQRPGGRLDLARVLADVVEHSPVTADLDQPDELYLPATAALALSQSVREALANVARHAGVEHATVAVSGSSDEVSVVVTDHGRGFDPATVSTHRRGISMSIVERMGRARGSATVQSRPGTGTTVRLSWTAR
jgi:signal transduction histidine kinase